MYQLPTEWVPFGGPHNGLGISRPVNRIKSRSSFSINPFPRQSHRERSHFLGPDLTASPAPSLALFEPVLPLMMPILGPKSRITRSSSQLDFPGSRGAMRSKNRLENDTRKLQKSVLATERRVFEIKIDAHPRPFLSTLKGHPVLVRLLDAGL